MDTRKTAHTEVDHEHLIRYVREFAPFLIERASGSYIYDQTGRAILDFTSGQMCATVGHNHPAVVEAVEQGCRQVMHLLSWFLSPPVIELCNRLADMLPPSLQKVLLLNTGGESNEVALRIAKLHSGKFEVAGLSASYHGLTAGAGSLTYSTGRKGYGPASVGTMVIPAPNCYRCPIRQCPQQCKLACLEAGFELIDSQSVGSLAAFIAEPVISAGGVIVPPPGYLARLKELCRARDMLLILDEAQTGLGRMGTNFAYEHENVVPDILTLSKTLGGGLPLSATIVSPEVEQDCYEKGFMHISSHVSDPLPALVGLAVLDVLKRENLSRNAAEMGQRLQNGLLDMQKRYHVVGDVRGRGLLWGVEIVKDRDTREPDHDLGSAISNRCLELGLSMNIVHFPGMSSVWRIAPPLTVSEEEIDSGLTILDQATRECVDI
ncbi:MAG: aspartate aminotransferase family protein [Pirellulales bacterium]|nr:aspartate aminotransferase family protein [Pirellulales bacterium]